MYHIVRKLKKHESNIMIFIILVNPVLSTNGFEEFFKTNTLRKSIIINGLLLLLLLLLS